VAHDAWLNRFSRVGQKRPGLQSTGQEIKINNPEEIVIPMDDDDDIETPSVNPDEISVDMDEPTPSTASEPVAATNNPDEIVMDDEDFTEPVTSNAIKVDIEEPVRSQPSHHQNKLDAHDELINETTEKVPALEVSDQGKVIRQIRKIELAH
jgi:hypothetical protein